LYIPGCGFLQAPLAVRFRARAAGSAVFQRLQQHPTALTLARYQPNIQTAWETLRLLAHGVEPQRGKAGQRINEEQLRKIDLHWHDLRHEGACRLLADGVDIRIIQLMLGHASIQQTQRYLNVTDEELRRGLEVRWNNKGRSLRLASES
jgi:integrase